MRLRITRISKYEQLLLEADIININNDLTRTGRSPEDVFNAIDEWLDALIDKDINKYLNNLNFINAFTAAQVVNTIGAYLEYCSKRINDAKEKLSGALNSEIPDPDFIKQLNIEVAKISERIDALKSIYDKSSAENLNNLKKKITDTKSEIFSYYYSPIQSSGELIRTSLEIVNKEADEIEQAKAAVSIIDRFVLLGEITQEYPDEVKAGVNSAREAAEKEMEKRLGKEKLNQIKNKGIGNIYFTKIVKDILEFEQLYSSEAEIKETARLLKTVRIAQNEFIDTETKEYLSNWVGQVEKILLEKARDKSIELDLNKGIHYDFNIKLPLFELVALPVTGKQIADSTFLARAKKKFLELSATILGSVNQTKEFNAGYELGKGITTAFTIGLNKVARVIGKAANGREGEMKADAISRMLMPTTDYLDNYLAKKTNEEAVGPGTAMQVPGSIGSMGPITPPTQTTLGSGDDFNPKKKKKRIMEFSEFLKNKI